MGTGRVAPLETQPAGTRVTPVPSPAIIDNPSGNSLPPAGAADEASSASARTTFTEAGNAEPQAANCDAYNGTVSAQALPVDSGHVDQVLKAAAQVSTLDRRSSLLLLDQNFQEALHLSTADSWMELHFSYKTFVMEFLLHFLSPFALFVHIFVTGSTVGIRNRHYIGMGGGKMWGIPGMITLGQHTIAICLWVVFLLCATNMQVIYDDGLSFEVAMIVCMWGLRTCMVASKAGYRTAQEQHEWNTTLVDDGFKRAEELVNGWRPMTDVGGYIEQAAMHLVIDQSQHVFNFPNITSEQATFLVNWPKQFFVHAKNILPMTPGTAFDPDTDDGFQVMVKHLATRIVLVGSHLCRTPRQRLLKSLGFDLFRIFGAVTLAMIPWISRWWLPNVPQPSTNASLTVVGVATFVNFMVAVNFVFPFMVSAVDDVHRRVVWLDEVGALIRTPGAGVRCFRSNSPLEFGATPQQLAQDRNPEEPIVPLTETRFSLDLRIPANTLNWCLLRKWIMAMGLPFQARIQLFFGVYLVFLIILDVVLIVQTGVVIRMEGTTEAGPNYLIVAVCSYTILVLNASLLMVVKYGMDLNSKFDQHSYFLQKHIFANDHCAALSREFGRDDLGFRKLEYCQRVLRSSKDLIAHDSENSFMTLLTLRCSETLFRLLLFEISLSIGCILIALGVLEWSSLQNWTTSRL
mmetsp:Transcript_41541/g.97437  ORF Transcript_41541/g.97437 Transcript_41541/m.97437 type:complete len:688 (+) Transcript_41541:144-2207(+)